MRTDSIMAFEIADGDHIKVGTYVYHIIELVEDHDYMLFASTDEEGELTQIPFAPFDTVERIVSFDEELDLSWVDEEVY